MTGKDLLTGLGYVSETYVEEAENAAAVRPRRWRTAAALAACLALILAAWAILPGRQGHIALPPDGVLPPTADGGGEGNPLPSTADGGEDGNPLPPAEAAGPLAGDPLVVDLSTVAVNELGASADSCRISLDPGKYDEILWAMEDVTAYYGRDPLPAYIPEGLSAGTEDPVWTTIVSKDGEIWEDTVGMVYAERFYEDGSPMSAALGGRTVRVSLSRLGLVSDCIYLLPDSEVQTTDIAGTAVTFGYREMSHGPYDPDTHIPAGYYDLYTAEFILDGVEYQIVAERVDLAELVKITASVITGQVNVEVTGQADVEITGRADVETS